MRTLDWLIVAGYLAWIITDGLRRTKDADKVEGFFLASRSLPWWVAGISGMATQLSAVTLVGTTGQAYATGPLHPVLFRFTAGDDPAVADVVPFFFIARGFTPPTNISSGASTSASGAPRVSCSMSARPPRRRPRRAGCRDVDHSRRSMPVTVAVISLPDGVLYVSAASRRSRGLMSADVRVSLGLFSAVAVLIVGLPSDVGISFRPCGLPDQPGGWRP